MSFAPRISSSCYGIGASEGELQSACKNAYGREWRYTHRGGHDSGCQTAFHTRIYCEHDGHKGDPYKCCTKGSSGESDLTCDPKYSHTSAECDQHMIKFCVGDNLISNKRCREWATNRPAVAYQNMKSYCTNVNNLGKEECRLWCQRQKDGTCDAAVTAYCNKNPKDPFCTCIKSKLTGRDYNINPKCFDADCLKTGFTTKTMAETPCPNIVDCTMNLKLANSGVNLANFKLNQNCTSTVVSGGGSSSVPTVLSPVAVEQVGMGDMKDMMPPAASDSPSPLHNIFATLAASLSLSLETVIVLFMCFIAIILYYVLAAILVK